MTRGREEGMGGPDFVREEDEEKYADSTNRGLGWILGRGDGDDAMRVCAGLHSGEESMNLGFQEFWLVWRAVYRADGESVFPTKRHLSEQSARAEAERLARKHPGNEFYVLRSVAAVQVVSVQWSAAIAASDMPF